MQVTGKITHILPTESGQGKNGEWQKRTVVLLPPDAKYPKPIAVQQWNDAIDDTPLSVGDELTFHINIESREYQGRWYTDVKAWKIEGHSAVAEPEPAPSVDDSADLPF